MACLAATAGVYADTSSREFTLSVNVSSPVASSLAGKSFSLHHNGFDVEYSATETTLDNNGKCAIKVYGGNHTLKLQVPGCKAYSSTFDVDNNKSIDINLQEEISDPYSLKADLIHDVHSGRNDVVLNWNQEEAVFFDDFESYDPFSISPNPWTGIDVDKYPAAQLAGSYPNSGKPQYITIVNPTAVNPAWDLQYYYTLAPRSGNQYAAFVQPTAGANNDWFITPSITLGDDNILRFYVRSADAEPARIKVGITTAENPSVSDFTTISEGNFITPDFSDWMEVRIPLDNYAGQTVKIGFNCTSKQGTLMTMLDDVFVGRINDYNTNAKAERIVQRSPANPNEKFFITLNGNKIAETENYSYTIENIADGEHTFGVQSIVVTGASGVTTTKLNIDSRIYAKAAFNVMTNNGRSTDGISLLIADAHKSYSCPLADGKAELASLPKGDYRISINADGYDAFEDDFKLDGDKLTDITLVESIITPFNIVADVDDKGNGKCDINVSWNRDLGFSDGFESYPDFAQGNFGDWITYNFNGEHQVSYPISYEGSIVQYPGCTTSDAPRSVPPIVFNPLNTRPSLKSDAGFLAPEGNKYVAFMSPQQVVADKWLISPKIKIYDGYEFAFTGKSYGGYFETVQICVSEGSENPDDFTVLDEVTMPFDTWTRYSVDLADYAGKEIRAAIHHITYDGFVAQIDDVAIAPAENSILHTGAGFVQTYDVTLDGANVANVTKPAATIADVAHGSHKIGVAANFATGKSPEAFYLIDTTSVDEISDAAISKVVAGVGEINVTVPTDADIAICDIAGKIIAKGKYPAGNHSFKAAEGIYILSIGREVFKLKVR